MIQTGAALRLTQLPRPGAIPVHGMNRIRVLDPLFHAARGLRIWSDSDTGTSAWEVTFATGRFFLMLSPELYRGFSGEGQVLEKLAGRRWREALPYVQSRLAWQSQIDSAALACEIGLTVEEVDDAYHWKSSGAVDLRIVVRPQLVESPGNEARPTVALHEATVRGSRLGFGTPWMHQWSAQIWPLNADAFLAGGGLSLADRVNAAPSAFAPNHVFLEPLLEPDRPWTEMGYLALAVALVSKDSDSRGAALDALIAGIEDGRAAPARLAEVLVRLLPGGWMKLNRVQQSLAEVARVSPLHAGSVAQLLEAFFLGVPTLPPDTQHLLGLLLELLTDLQTGPSEPLRRRLQDVRCSGKSAKLARSLLALTAEQPSPKFAQACRQVCETRLARAERWAASVPAPAH